MYQISIEIIHKIQDCPDLKTLNESWYKMIYPYSNEIIYI